MNFIDTEKLKIKLKNEQLFGIGKKDQFIYAEQFNVSIDADDKISCNNYIYKKLSMDNIDNLYSSISIESISKAPISDVHVYLTEDGNYIKPEWKCDLTETSKLIMDSELCRKELIGVDVSYTYIVFFLNSNGLGIPMIIASQYQGASIEDYIQYYGDHDNIEYTKITDEETRFNIIQQYMCEDNLSSRLGLDIDNIVEFYESEEKIDIEDNIVSYYNPDLMIKARYDTNKKTGTISVEDHELFKFVIPDTVSMFALQKIPEKLEDEFEIDNHKIRYELKTVNKSNIVETFKYYIDGHIAYDYIYSSVNGSSDKSIVVHNIVANNYFNDYQAISIVNPFMSNYQDNHVKFNYSEDYKNISSFVSFIYDLNNIYLRGPLWIPIKINV